MCMLDETPGWLLNGLRSVELFLPGVLRASLFFDPTGASSRAHALSRLDTRGPRSKPSRASCQAAHPPRASPVHVHLIPSHLRWPPSFAHPRETRAALYPVVRVLDSVVRHETTRLATVRQHAAGFNVPLTPRPPPLSDLDVAQIISKRLERLSMLQVTRAAAIATRHRPRHSPRLQRTTARRTDDVTRCCDAAADHARRLCTIAAGGAHRACRAAPRLVARRDRAAGEGEWSAVGGMRSVVGRQAAAGRRTAVSGER